MDHLNTIVENKMCMVLGRTNWKRAMRLWFLEKAEVIETHSHIVYSNKDFSIQAPKRIRLTDFALPLRNKSLPLTKKNLYYRDKGKCAYCGAMLSLEKATVDHILPMSKGGRTRWENVTIACSECNFKKNDRTPEQAGLKILNRVYVPKIYDSFFFDKKVI